MTRYPLILLLLSAFLAFPTARRVAAQPSASAKPVDECRVLARVNGVVVMASEVLWQVNLQLERVGNRIPPEEIEKARAHFAEQILMSMIDTRIIYGDFRRKAPAGIDFAQINENLEEPFLKNEVPRLMEVVGAERQGQLETRLVELGTSLRDRRDDFNKQMIARSWLSEGLEFNNEVTRQEMLDYYQQHASEYEYPTQAKWEELMVSFDQHPSKGAAYKKLAVLGNAQVFPSVQRVQNPTAPAFAEIAKQHSDGLTASKGGQHDWTTKGALAAERVDEALFSLKIGELSPIIESAQGWHIVRVLERKEAGRTPFTDVQQKIRDSILNQRHKVAVNKKLAQLRKEASIWTVYTGDMPREGEAVAGKPDASTQR